MAIRLNLILQGHTKVFLDLRAGLVMIEHRRVYLGMILWLNVTFPFTRELLSSFHGR